VIELRARFGKFVKQCRPRCGGIHFVASKVYFEWRLREDDGARATTPSDRFFRVVKDDEPAGSTIEVPSSRDDIGGKGDCIRGEALRRVNFVDVNLLRQARLTGRLDEGLEVSRRRVHAVSLGTASRRFARRAVNEAPGVTEPRIIVCHEREFTRNARDDHIGGLFAGNGGDSLAPFRHDTRFDQLFDQREAAFDDNATMPECLDCLEDCRSSEAGKNNALNSFGWRCRGVMQNGDSAVGPFYRVSGDIRRTRDDDERLIAGHRQRFRSDGRSAQDDDI
jgi:hypothetical protein